jgi:hypothetical protein
VRATPDLLDAATSSAQRQTVWGLVTDENLCPLVFKGPTRLMDIHAVDFSVLSKILFPHQKTAAAINTDLEYVDLSTDESAKVSLMDVEIVSPLPNSRSFFNSPK